MSLRKIVTKGEFEELHVQFISVLRGNKNPANRRRVLIRAVAGETEFEIQAKVTKVVKGEKPTIYICIYEPNIKDTQEDWIVPSKLTKTAHEFLKNGLVSMIDDNHNFIPGMGHLVESAILNSTDDDRYPDIAKGAWVGAIEPTEALLPYLDEITGVSLAGTGIYKSADEESEEQPKKPLARSAKRNPVARPLTRKN